MIVIFGGTTEGRQLAEFCEEEKIPAIVCVATDFGASLVTGMRVRKGKMNADKMTEFLRLHHPYMAVDATHPYAEEATRNICIACKKTDTPYVRLLRERTTICGDTVESMKELVSYLDMYGGVILSTLGSKYLPYLTKVHDYGERIWVRVLAAEGAEEQCRQLGYRHILTGMPPYTITRNIEDIRISGAGLLVTKESGSAGGYPEKAAAARQCGIGMVTLARPQESGMSITTLMAQLREMKK